MSAIMQKIENCEPLYYGDIRNLVNDYDSDTAYRVEAVLSCLKAMQRKINAGAEYQFHDQCGVVRAISSNSFKEFVLKYFSERAYCNILGKSVPPKSSNMKKIDVMSVRKKLGTDEILTYEDIFSLIEFYKTDTDTACEWTINTLHFMYDYLNEGKAYRYYDISGNLNDLAENGFKDFVMRFFDGQMYLWVLNEIKNNHYW